MGLFHLVPADVAQATSSRNTQYRPTRPAALPHNRLHQLWKIKHERGWTSSVQHSGGVRGLAARRTMTETEQLTCSISMMRLTRKACTVSLKRRQHQQIPKPAPFHRLHPPQCSCSMPALTSTGHCYFDCKQQRHWAATWCAISLHAND